MTGLLPLILGWLGGVALLSCDGRKRLVQQCAALVLGVMTIANVTLLLSGAAVDLVTGPWDDGIGIRLFADEVSFFFGAISSLSLLVALLHEMSAQKSSRLFPSMVLLMGAGLHGAFFTADLFNFYVFFELSVVTSFVLATHDSKESKFGGALTYVSVNLLGSILFLFGIAGIYAITGEVDLLLLSSDRPELSRGTQQVRALLPATGLIFAALSLKMGLFPFHGWLIATYRRVRPAVGAIFSAALVNLAFFGLLRMGWSVFDDVRNNLQPLLVAWGTTSILYGSLMAWRRGRSTEIIGYAAVMQAGYVVLLLAVGSDLARVGVLCVALAGALDKATLFFVLDSKGRGRSPATFIAAFGLVGAPLTVGFIAKVILFRTSLQLPGRQGAAALCALTLATLFTFLATVRIRQAILEKRPSGSPPAWAGSWLAALSVLFGLVALPAIDEAMHLDRKNGLEDAHLQSDGANASRDVSAQESESSP